MYDPTDRIKAERLRIQAEYQRRKREGERSLYAPWQPAEVFIRAKRKQAAAELLHAAGVFPGEASGCLEVGCGRQGWLGDLISWGVRETSLHGIDLIPERVEAAREILPMADLRVGDATALPWPENTFRLVISSNLFSSVLDPLIRSLIAAEIVRVIRPGGALLWYDAAVNNPRNPNLRKVGRAEIGRLFAGLEGKLRPITLAAPLVRFMAARSCTLTAALEAIPWLRTHLIGVLLKKR